MAARHGRAQPSGAAATKQSSEVDPKKPRFLRKGQAWFCITGLPSNIIVEVDEMLFHLHKLPLVTRSGKISNLAADAAPSDDDDPVQGEDDNDNNLLSGHPIPGGHGCCIQLHGMPGGAETFELVAKFCYGVKLELMASNVASLRCAAEYLHMTEEYGEANLITVTENFINNVIVRSWKDSVMALKSCEGFLPLAEDLSILRKCVDSIALKVCTEPSLYGWPVIDERYSFHSRKGRVLLNNSMVRPKDPHLDWWYEDLSVLSLPLFKCVISAMEDKGLRAEAIASALMYYARKSIPGMHRRQDGKDGLARTVAGHPVAPSGAEQLFFLQTIESLLPWEEAVVTTSFLSGLLKISMIQNANEGLRENLERRIGAQLEQATTEDILIPGYSGFSETLYDVDCVERIVQHYLGTRKALVMIRRDIDRAPSINRGASSSGTNGGMIAVANVMDSYMAEIASDVNLGFIKFQAILEVLPAGARALDDGMYKAIDIFLKAHPWLPEAEKDALCKAMNPEKLSQQACKHAAQNKRLPLRVVAQVLFLEQAQLRAAFTGALEAATSRPSVTTSRPSAGAPTPATTPPTDQRVSSWRGSDMSGQVLTEEMQLQTDLAGLRRRMAGLERECNRLRHQLLGQRRVSGWASLFSKFSCRSLSDVSNNTSDTRHHIGLDTSVQTPRQSAASTRTRG